MSIFPRITFFFFLNYWFTYIYVCVYFSLSLSKLHSKLIKKNDLTYHVHAEENLGTRDTRQSIQATEHKASEWINDVTAGVWLLCAFGHTDSVKTKRNRGVEGARISASFIIHMRELRERVHISTYLFVIFVRHEFRFDARTRGNCRSRARVSPLGSFHLCTLR